MMPFFSIIIPVYNIAPYLRECLDSVLAQTFPDWEAICVDDGSTDGSGAILDEYAKKDSRFRVIHQPNAGVSVARNMALDTARGKWFVFLDGDDILRNDGLETFLPYIGVDECDGILVHPYIPYWKGENIPPRKISTGVLVENATKEDLIFGPYAANGFPFSRAYKRAVFGHLRFRKDIAMAEDICFWFDALCLDARWTIINAEYYLYRQRPDSACGLKNPHLCVQGLESTLHAIRVIGKMPGVAQNAKLRYVLRFPYTIVYNLNLAITYRTELADEEWQQIRGKVEEIEANVECWPFSRWLKFKVALACNRACRWLLPFTITGENVYLGVRHLAGRFVRKTGLIRKKEI